MHIAFDLHGVLTNYPRMFSPLMSLLRSNGVKISIMSGPPRDEVVSELNNLELFRYVHYDHVISIVDYLHHKEATMRKEDGTWWTDDETWWRSKGELCHEFKVDILIDNSIGYEPYINKQETMFLLLK